jgi:hypothetical protein
MPADGCRPGERRQKLQLAAGKDPEPDLWLPVQQPGDGGVHAGLLHPLPRRFDMQFGVALP